MLLTRRGGLVFVRKVKRLIMMRYARLPCCLVRPFRVQPCRRLLKIGGEIPLIPWTRFYDLEKDLQLTSRYETFYEEIFKLGAE